MRIILILCITSYCAFPATITGYDLFRSLNKKNSTDIFDFNDYETAGAFIAGVISGLNHSKKLYTSIIKEYIHDEGAKDNLGIIFMPINKSWNPQQYRDLVHIYLRENPHVLHLSASEIVVLALFNAAIVSNGDL
tara:strand:+ start:26875 stop:27279 length:405 start_codon:yes stop_codon:yes gene_type:complete